MSRADARWLDLLAAERPNRPGEDRARHFADYVVTVCGDHLADAQGQFALKQLARCVAAAAVMRERLGLPRWSYAQLALHIMALHGAGEEFIAGHVDAIFERAGGFVPPAETIPPDIQ